MFSEHTFGAIYHFVINVIKKLRAANWTTVIRNQDTQLSGKRVQLSRRKRLRSFCSLVSRRFPVQGEAKFKKNSFKREREREEGKKEFQLRRQQREEIAELRNLLI